MTQNTLTVEPLFIEIVEMMFIVECDLNDYNLIIAVQ